MLNKKILEKAKIKTENDYNLRDLLSCILDFENSRGSGYYEAEYTKFLEAYIKKLEGLF